MSQLKRSDLMCACCVKNSTDLGEFRSSKRFTELATDLVLKMFNNVQWRIALWFIGLSTAVYIIPTALAMVLFYMNLTATIDGELKVFMASFGHAINVSDGKPVLRNWARTVETDPAHSLVSYQLFDREGKFLEAHGQQAIAILFKEKHELFNNGICMRT